MINYPKITIVTPSFNQGQFLEDTILSVLGQNYPSLEYIIMDGGSSDNSVAIIKKYESSLFHWESKKDKGQANAINKGFSISSGNILMWLNSDDLLMPNILHYIAQLYLDNGNNLFIGNCIHFKQTESLWSLGSDIVTKSQNNKIEDLAYVIQPSSFWTRDIWEDTGLLNEDLDYTFDWEWFIRVSKKGWNYFAIPTVLSLYRYHAEHKSGVGGVKRQDEIYNLLNQYSPHLAVLYKYLMSTGLNVNLSLKQEKKLNRYKLLCRLKRKKYNQIDILKYLYPFYEEFTEIEIMNMNSML